jgi:hypothetical protein
MKMSEIKGETMIDIELLEKMLNIGKLVKVIATKTEIHYTSLESGMCGSVTFKEYEEYLTTIKG